MGSCISKCCSKKKIKEDYNLVQDKLVISQASGPSVIVNPETSDHKPVSPAPSSVSSASFLSFSCSNGGLSNGHSMASSALSSSSSSCSSLCSTSTSALGTKDRSFSNEFLWSCVKENPHVTGINQAKKGVEKSAVFPRVQPQINSFQSLAKSVPRETVVQEMILEEMVQHSTPKKRSRASSPTLVRQKSFRKEQNFVNSIPNRSLMRSPSPSRRFTGDNTSKNIIPTNGTKSNSCRNSPVISRQNTSISASSGRKRENSRPQTASPIHDLTRRNASILSRGDVIRNQINAKTEDISIGEVRCNQSMDLVLEDINNPLIALDCFIFL